MEDKDLTVMISKEKYEELLADQKKLKYIQDFLDEVYGTSFVSYFDNEEPEKIVLEKIYEVFESK